FILVKKRHGTGSDFINDPSLSSASTNPNTPNNNLAQISSNAVSVSQFSLLDTPNDEGAGNNQSNPDSPTALAHLRLWRSPTLLAYAKFLMTGYSHFGACDTDEEAEYGSKEVANMQLQ